MASLCDTALFPIRVAPDYGWSMRWMRRRGDRVIIISGTYEGHRGTVEANVYLKSEDYPDELANGFHVLLDSEELVTVRWDPVAGCCTS